MMKTMRERAAAARISVTEVTETTGLVELDGRWAPGTRSFMVTMRNRSTGEVLTTPWHIGPLSDSYPNRPDELLDCLASDAAGYLNAGSYEEYAAEYGGDPDSRAGEAAYRVVGQATEKLRVFLGDDFDDFVYDTERL